MRARYIDLPADKVPHGVNNPEVWERDYRGKGIEIDPHPVDPDTVVGRYCHDPYFLIKGQVTTTKYGRVLPLAECIHRIELDESTLDAEVEHIFKELPTCETSPSPSHSLSGPRGLYRPLQ